MTKQVHVTIDRKASVHEVYATEAGNTSNSFPIANRAALFAYIARQDAATVRIELSGAARQDKVIRAIEATGARVEVTRRGEGFALVEVRAA